MQLLFVSGEKQSHVRHADKLFDELSELVSKCTDL